MINPSEWAKISPEQKRLKQLSQKELLDGGYQYSVYQYTKNCKVASGQPYYELLGSRELLKTSRLLFKSKREAVAHIEGNRNIYGSLLCKVKPGCDLELEEL